MGLCSSDGCFPKKFARTPPCRVLAPLSDDPRLDEQKLSDAAASAQQIDDYNYQGYDQQQVDKTSTDVKAESEKPQNRQNHDYCPKHVRLSFFDLRITS